MRAVLLSLLLSACSPWYQHAQLRPNSIVIHSVHDVANRCGQSSGTVTGCAFHINESNTAHVYIASDLPQDMWACTLAHEAYHAAGYRHNGNMWECK